MKKMEYKSNGQHMGLVYFTLVQLANKNLDVFQESSINLMIWSE